MSESTIRHALFVDDEALILEFLGELCEEQEIPCLMADSPRKAIEVVQNDHVRVVVTDYSMPEMDGLEFAKRIRTQGFNGPIFFYSSYARQLRTDPKIRDLEIPPSFIFEKPYDGIRLMSRVRDALFPPSSKSPPSGGRHESTPHFLPAPDKFPIRISLGDAGKGYPIENVKSCPAVEDRQDWHFLVSNLIGKQLHMLDPESLEKDACLRNLSYLPAVVEALHEMKSVIGTPAHS